MPTPKDEARGFLSRMNFAAENGRRSGSLRCARSIRGITAAGAARCRALRRPTRFDLTGVPGFPPPPGSGEEEASRLVDCFSGYGLSTPWLLFGRFLSRQLASWMASWLESQQVGKSGRRHSGGGTQAGGTQEEALRQRAREQASKQVLVGSGESLTWERRKHIYHKHVRSFISLGTSRAREISGGKLGEETPGNPSNMLIHPRPSLTPPPPLPSQQSVCFEWDIGSLLFFGRSMSQLQTGRALLRPTPSKHTEHRQPTHCGVPPC